MNNLTVRDLMTTVVHALKPTSKLSEARATFEGGLYRHLPVADEDGRLLGLVSTSDLLELTCEAYGAESETMGAVIDRQFNLLEVMTTNLATVSPDDPLRHAAALLAEGPFHSLPVLNADGKLVGMLTSTDLIECLLDLLSKKGQ